MCLSVCFWLGGTYEERARRTTLWSWFSPSTFLWVPGMELRSLGWHDKTLSPATHSQVSHSSWATRAGAMKNPNMSEEQVIQVQDPPAWVFVHLIWLRAKQLMIKWPCMLQAKSQFKQALQKNKCLGIILTEFFFSRTRTMSQILCPNVGSVPMYHGGSWPGSHVLAAHSIAEQLLPAS